MLSGKISSFYHFFSFFVDHAQLNGSGEVPRFIFHELGLRIEKAILFFFKKQAKLRLGCYFFKREHFALPFRERRHATAAGKKDFFRLLG